MAGTCMSNTNDTAPLTNATAAQKILYSPVIGIGAVDYLALLVYLHHIVVSKYN